MMRLLLVLMVLEQYVSTTKEFLMPHSGLAREVSWAVPSHDARLYCDIKGEELSTVLWYRDENAEPIYTFDARGSAGSAYHWTEQQPIGLGKRAEFMLADPVAFLEVRGVRKEDMGVYRCRVDFKHTQTRNSLVELRMVETPTRLTIYHEHQEASGLVGPVSAGDSVNLRCVVEGGAPPPLIHWLRNNVLVDSSWEVVGDQVEQLENRMILHGVGRAESLDSFSCQAANTNLTRPIVRSIRIGVNFPPSEVEISELAEDLYAGRTQHVKCTAKGSYPSAAISWWKDGQYLQRPAENKEANQTVSYLDLQFNKDDNGRILTCRAQNPLIQDSIIEEKIRLNVKYSPQVDLVFGATINPRSIREGQDLYIDCKVDANPPIHKILWSHNGFPVMPRRNVIMSGQNLVVQGVHRDQGGNYTCTVSNVVGDAVSRPLLIKVQHKPVCAVNVTKDVFVDLKELVEVVCRVSATPAPAHFWWTFNNTFQLGKLPREIYMWEGHRSTLRYLPTTLLDFGVLSCWASNPLGTMEQPCRYSVWQAGTHKQTLECNLHNQTLTSLIVSCSGEAEGTPTNIYHLEVRERDSGDLVQNLTSDSPWFFIQDLPPEVSTSGLNLTVYTSDTSGRSRSRQTLGVFSSKVAELQAETGEEEVVDHVYLLGIGMGLLLSILILLVAMLITIRISRSRNVSRETEADQQYICQTQPEQDGGHDVTQYDGVDLLAAVSSSIPRQVHLREEIFVLKKPSSGGGSTMLQKETRIVESDTLHAENNDQPQSDLVNDEHHATRDSSSARRRVSEDGFYPTFRVNTTLTRSHTRRPARPSNASLTSHDVFYAGGSSKDHYERDSSKDSYVAGSSKDPLIHASITSLLESARQESIL